MSDPDNTRERLAEALLCRCGHDIGGEHNTNGCYATVDYGQRTQRACDCTRTDEQDPLDALLPLIDTLLREQREGIAAAIAWEAGGREAQAFHAHDEDVEFFGSKQRLTAEAKALLDAVRIARTVGGERQKCSWAGCERARVPGTVRCGFHTPTDIDFGGER